MARRRSLLVERLPHEVEQALLRLGANIRTARLRRGLPLVDLAWRVGISRFALAGVERGKPTTTIAAYFGALWALGLIDQAAALADPDRDEEGKALERARAPNRARQRKATDNDF